MAKNNNSNSIAIDLAKNVFQVCILSPNHKVIPNKFYALICLEKVPELIISHQAATLTMEACYSNHYWVRLFSDMDHEVEVQLLPKPHVKPFVRGNKNDSNDSLAITETSWRLNIKHVLLKIIKQQDTQTLYYVF